MLNLIRIDYTAKLVLWTIVALLLIFLSIRPALGDQPRWGRYSGAGSSFIGPFCMEVFDQHNSVGHDYFDYEFSGTMGGLHNLLSGDSDFLLADVPLSACGGVDDSQYYQLPICGEAIGVAFNLGRNVSKLNLTGNVLAEIFLGRIKNWNDPRIQIINPEISLPHIPIHVIEVKGHSPQTLVFTRYLSSVNPYWASHVGYGKSVKWPTGVAERGAGWCYMLQNVGVITYYDIIYEYINGKNICSICNRAGKYIHPDVDSASAGLRASVPTTLKNVGSYVVNPSGTASYPIVGYSYLVVPKDVPNPDERRALQELLHILTDEHAQNIAASLYYPVLPKAVVQLDERLLSK